MTASKKKVVLSCVILGCLSASGVAWWALRSPEVRMPTTVEEGIAFAASKDFKKLPEYRQDAYRDEVRRLMQDLSEKDRHALFEKLHDNEELREGLREVRPNPIHDHLKRLAQADPEERKKILDEIIDEMEKRRQSGDMRPPGRDGGGGPPRGEGPGGPRGLGGGRRRGGGASNLSAEQKSRMLSHIQNQVQTGNPQRHAQMTEFHRAIDQRRQERGLPTGPGR